MTHKHNIKCGNCGKLVGFSISSEPLTTIYCFSCEDFVTHKEEMDEKYINQYNRYSRS